jgi:hypothetical protein
MHAVLLPSSSSSVAPRHEQERRQLVFPPGPFAAAIHQVVADACSNLFNDPTMNGFLAGGSGCMPWEEEMPLQRK